MNAQVRPFYEIPASDLPSRSLQNEMEERGYSLIREALPREELNHLLSDITSILSAAGWLLPGFDPLERMADLNSACGDPDPEFKQIYEQIFSLESLHTFAHHPSLQHIMHMLIGPRLLIHPKPIARLIFPNCERFVIHEHQDHQSIGGDPESFTAWIPLHDCPIELGPLQILESSHRFGLQGCNQTTGYIPKPRGSDWVGGAINAGDVLLFHSLTVHAASPNLSNRLRISLDCRFQDYDRAINPASLVFAGKKSWESTYASWRSNELKYYWKQVPLTFKPSKLELEQLSQTADSPAMRSRFAKILSQLD